MKQRSCIVDDDPFLLDMYNLKFQQAGYDVVCFTDSEKASEALRNDGNFDAILLDLVMPNINGIEVCRYVKNNKETEAIRVIAMTGFLSETTRKEFESAGAETVLAKPFDFDILGDIIFNSNAQPASSIMKP